MRHVSRGRTPTYKVDYDIPDKEVISGHEIWLKQGGVVEVLWALIMNLEEAESIYLIRHDSNANSRLPRRVVSTDATRKSLHDRLTALHKARNEQGAREIALSDVALIQEAGTTITWLLAN